MTGKPVQQEERDFVTDNYLTIPKGAIARHLGRSTCFVFGEMKRQGLVVPPDIKQKFIDDSHFSGEPYNKGKKQTDYMSPEAIERTKATRFKKGNKPHNTRKDLDISLRVDGRGNPYYWIRVSLSNWMHLHRYLWVQAYGAIPKGHNIQFKDGDPFNTSLDNLYMVTRKQQAVHNKLGGKKIPYELRETLLIITKLKQKYKSYEKQNSRSK